VKLFRAEAGHAGEPLVILLHGFPEFSFAWRNQIPALAAAGFHVVAPDQRGYGQSPKPQRVSDYHLRSLAHDILDLADEYEARTFSLVGHDWGGVVAWYIASRWPERLSRLVILNAPHPGIFVRFVARHPGQILRSAYMGFFQLPVPPELLLRSGDFTLLRRVLVSTSGKGAFSEDDLERYREAWRAPGTLTGMLNWYRALRYWPRVRRLVDPPTLILWGDRDPFLRSGLAEASLSICTQGQAIHFPEASHWIHLEMPSEVNSKIITFLTG
jgi:pimeloyl-ACP methyl ester carboxylesterase